MSEAILVPLIVFSAIPLTSWVILHHRVKARAKNAEVVTAMVENGKEVTPEIIKAIGFAPKRRHKDLKWALILIAISLGFVMFGTVVPDHEEEAQAVMTGLASFPFFVGMALLAFWFIISRNEQD